MLCGKQNESKLTVKLTTESVGMWFSRKMPIEYDKNSRLVIGNFCNLRKKNYFYLLQRPQIIKTMGRQWMMAVKVQFIFIYQKFVLKPPISFPFIYRTFAIISECVSICFEYAAGVGDDAAAAAIAMCYVCECQSVFFSFFLTLFDSIEFIVRRERNKYGHKCTLMLCRFECKYELS